MTVFTRITRYLSIIVLMTTLLASVNSCSGNSPFPELEDGDLIFQANPGSRFVSAIEAVTEAGDSLMSFSHVGIIRRSHGGVYVIEATPEKGVAVTPIGEFLDGSAHDSSGCPLVRVMRYTGEDREQVCSRAIGIALSFLGKEYDFAFDPGPEAFYCSELVHSSFVDDAGEPIFRSNPMTFKDSTGNTSPLWEDYYRERGREIPEGAPGTNPNDMSREPLLVKVEIDFL